MKAVSDGRILTRVNFLSRHHATGRGQKVKVRWNVSLKRVDHPVIQFLSVAGIEAKGLRVKFEFYQSIHVCSYEFLQRKSNFHSLNFHFGIFTWHMNSRGLSCALRIWSSSLSLLSHFTCLTPSGQPFFDIRTPTNIDTSKHLSGMENCKAYGFLRFTWAISIASPQRSTITDTLSSGRSGSFNSAIILLWPWKYFFSSLVSFHFISFFRKHINVWLFKCNFIMNCIYDWKYYTSVREVIPYEKIYWVWVM